VIERDAAARIMDLRGLSTFEPPTSVRAPPSNRQPLAAVPGTIRNTLDDALVRVYGAENAQPRGPQPPELRTLLTV